MADIWSLTTMSFKGTVPGAVHIYGVLSGPHGRHYKVCELLNKQGADELNAHAERMEKTWLKYEPDEPAEVFMREEDLYECARVAFLFLAAPGDALMVGIEPALNPSQIIEAPPEVRERLTAIWSGDDESLSWGEQNRVRDEANEAWCKTVADLGLETASDSYHPDAHLNAIVDRYPGLVDADSPCGYRASVTLEVR